MDSHHISRHWLGQIDAAGRFLLPAECRKVVGWDRGANIIIETDGDSLRILSLDRFTEEVQSLFGQANNDKPESNLPLSEQLIEARKREAERDRRSD